jgi:SAM-dependent methyltransferase
MNSAPTLFDTALAISRASRRMRLNDGADFLFQRVADDLKDRLSPVLRPFAEIHDIGLSNETVAKALKDIRPESNITRRSFEEHQAPLEDLRLKPESADLITSALVLQHANDLPGLLVQIRRGLKPDGLFMGCLAGGSTLTELRQSLTEAESEILGGVSPRVFPFADTRDMGGLLQRAGFALPVTDSEAITVRYRDMLHLIQDLRLMGATNVLTARSKRPTQRAIFIKAAEIYAQKFADPDGKIRATFEIIWLSGWAPHESQQKPLRPGSAKQRLADALGVPEQKPLV